MKFEFSDVSVPENPNLCRCAGGRRFDGLECTLIDASFLAQTCCRDVEGLPEPHFLWGLVALPEGVGKPNLYLEKGKVGKMSAGE